MKEKTFAESAQELRDDIAQTRETLRTEHFPYEEGKSVYAALHEALRLMGDYAEAYVKWAEYYPHQSPEPEGMERFRTIHLIHDGIKRELG